MCAMNPRLLRPLASGFNPKQIAGLEAWWDAADAASVTLDSGRVSQLNDKSGRGIHAANSSSGSTQPDYVTAARNGRNVVRFAAASTQRLTVGSSTAAFNFLHNGTESYVIAVASFGDSANPDALFALWGNNALALANIGANINYEDRSVASVNNALRAQITRGSVANVAVVVNDGVLTPQVANIIETTFDADASTADRILSQINGGSDLGGNTFTGSAISSNASFDFQLGCGGNNTFPMTGDICEILIYSQRPPETARSAIRRYLAAKWGVTLA